MTAEERTSRIIRRIQKIASDHLAFLQATIVRWIAKYREIESAREDFDRRRGEHEKLIRENPTLRHKKNRGAAEKGWQFIQYSCLCGEWFEACFSPSFPPPVFLLQGQCPACLAYRERRAVLIDDQYAASSMPSTEKVPWCTMAWTPPDLLPETRPVLPLTPLDHDAEYQETSFEGKLVGLVAFHDEWGPRFSENVRPINPWGWSGAGPDRALPEGPDGGITDDGCNGFQFFLQMRIHAKRMSEEKFQRLELALDEVERELDKRRDDDRRRVAGASFEPTSSVELAQRREPDPEGWCTMPLDAQQLLVLQRCMGLTDSLIMSCYPPSEYARSQGLSEFWFNLDHVQQLVAGLHDLRLGTWAVNLWQEAKRAEQARAEAHASTLRKIGGGESRDHDHLMAAENGERIGLGHVLLDIRRELHRIAGRPNTYQRIRNYIETVGERDESGGYTVVESIESMHMTGELAPVRKQPLEPDPDKRFVRYIPEIGTPEYYAANCWELSRRLDEDTEVGRRPVRYFPAEAMRHLALAAGPGDEKHLGIVSTSPPARVAGAAVSLPTEGQCNGEDVAKLQPAHKLAYRQREHAQEEGSDQGRRVEPGHKGDDAAHRWLTEHGDDDGNKPCVLGTWKRYLREARRVLGESAKRSSRPRSTRPLGKSIVRQSQI